MVLAKKGVEKIREIYGSHLSNAFAQGKEKQNHCGRAVVDSGNTVDARKILGPQYDKITGDFF